MPGLEGWNGRDIRFQPGSNLSSVGTAAFTVKSLSMVSATAVPALFETLPASSVAFSDTV